MSNDVLVDSSHFKLEWHAIERVVYFSSVPTCLYFYIINFVPFTCPTSSSSVGVFFLTWFPTNHFAPHDCWALGPSPLGTSREEGSNMSVKTLSCLAAGYLHSCENDSGT